MPYREMPIPAPQPTGGLRGAAQPFLSALIERKGVSGSSAGSVEQPRHPPPQR